MSDTTKRDDFARAAAEFELKIIEREGLKDSMAVALTQTDAWEQRKRKLPALFMFYFVLLMALHREKSIGSMLNAVVLMLRDRLPDRDLPLKSVTNEAVIRARYRLGVEPVKVLFETLASRVEVKPSFYGFRVYGVDGVSMTMPDTPGNEERFGRPSASRGNTAFPQTKMTVLVASDTHEVVNVHLGQWKHSEREACERMLSGLSEKDLLTMDRGISATWLFECCNKLGVNYLARITTAWKPYIEKKLGPGDWLVKLVQRVKLSPDERTPGGPATREVTVKARLIEGKSHTGERVRIVTSLLDPKRYRAKKLLMAYHLRWENELAYDELKTHFATVKHGTLHVVFRSKKPEGVEQEAYAMLTVYNIIRGLMREAAESNELAPLKLSFVQCHEVIKEMLPRIDSAPKRNLPRLLAQLKDDLAQCRIDRPRRARRNPRKVRVKMSKFKLKRSNDRGQRYNPRRSLALNDMPQAERAA